MQINPALPEDIPALCELLAHLFQQEAEFTPDDAAQRRALAMIIDHPEVSQILVARRGDDVVGMVNLLYTVSTAMGGRVALLEDMIVAPHARGVGVGSQLLGHALALARMSGCLRITLLTDRTNAAALRFYQRHGFIASAMVPLRLALDEGGAGRDTR